MLDTIQAVWGAISWGWIGLTVALGLAGAACFYFGFRSLAVYCWIGAAFCGWTGGLITDAQLARVERDQARQETADAKAETVAVQARLNAQNARLKALAAESAKRDADALAALRAADEIAKKLVAEIDRLKTLPTNVTCEQAIDFVKGGW
jgi:hypothetical protein